MENIFASVHLNIMEKLVNMVPFMSFFHHHHHLSLSLEFEHTRVDSPGRSRKDHCSSSPCRNGAECVSLNTTYYCRCKRPYYGINCDKRMSSTRK